jgi:hypothetical protein
MYRIYQQYGIRHFFGTDDNFFNNKQRAVEMLQTLASAQFDGFVLRKKARWGTEVTVHDTLAMREHLHLAQKAGVRALWLGVEDMTGALVRKGQQSDRTAEAFRLLCRENIAPMPMMMHHDSQPLISRGSDKGLLNQVNLLRKAGAVSLQVLMLTPSAGAPNFEESFTSGMVLQSAAGRAVQPHMYDGNYVIASSHKRPWRKQLNILASYIFFYNPIRLFVALCRHKGRLGFKPALMQFIGMYGLAHSIRRTLGWALRLMTGWIKRYDQTPAGPFPMRTPSGGIAPHARGRHAVRPGAASSALEAQAGGEAAGLK